MNDKLNQLILEKQKRSMPDLLKDGFQYQNDFIKDKSRRKVALCTRRAGKSMAAGLMFAITGLTYPGCTMTYLAMTCDSARKTMYKDIIEPINDKFNLNLDITQRRVVFPNGSIIYFVGIDSKEDEKKKLLGQKNKLVIIDEAQDITVNLEELIKRVVGPTLWDSKGQLVMLGTPSDHTKTYYYNITNEYKSKLGWSYHQWSALDNPYMKDEVLQEMEEEKKIDPSIETSPWFQQSFLGKWVINKNALIYKPNERNFDVEELPSNKEFIYLLGIDLGYKDADAFVVVAYGLTDNKLYIEEVHIQKGNDDIATGLMIKRLDQRFKFQRMIVDGSNLKGVETMRQRLGLNLLAADKGHKADYIRLFNMDLHAGIIKVLPKAKDALLNEWSSLIWDPKKPGKEKEGLDNHASDAALYAWRHAHNWSSQIPNEKKLTEEERYNQQLDGIILNSPKTVFDYLELQFDNKDDNEY